MKKTSAKSNMYYAIYDITDDSTRSDIVQILKNIGFVRIQKSVFCGNLTSQQRKDIIEMVKITIRVDSDSFYLILACKQCFGKIQIIGKGFDKAYVTNVKESMVI
jgi:CRISPR-associated protein Cas2